MKISEAIAKIKGHHRGVFHGAPIDDATTRDQILYGDSDQELKGVVTTCFASADVIREAVAQGANLIICHEALFWNHGDHTDWLQENRAFQKKKQLLDQGKITVWRDHDYIHSGIPLPSGDYTDGIFYGIMKALGWEEHLISSPEKPAIFSLPPTTVEALGRELMEKLHLNGVKIIGDLTSPVKKVWLPGHIDGRKDKEILFTTEAEDIDALITFECIDYTVAEYVRDSTMTGHPKTILATGHFNTEEPGMHYMLQYLPQILGDSISCSFVPSVDMYQFLV